MDEPHVDASVAADMQRGTDAADPSNLNQGLSQLPASQGDGEVATTGIPEASIDPEFEEISPVPSPSLEEDENTQVQTQLQSEVNPDMAASSGLGQQVITSGSSSQNLSDSHLDHSSV